MIDYTVFQPYQDTFKVAFDLIRMNQEPIVLRCMVTAETVVLTPFMTQRPFKTGTSWLEWERHLHNIHTDTSA